MKYLILAVMLLTACNSEVKEVVKVEVKPAAQVIATAIPRVGIFTDWTGFYSTWWAIPQLFNGVPKYSGAFGTYTNKHIPMAVWANGNLFHVRTDNTEDGNFRVYAMINNYAEVVVHTIENWNDPHTNASINVLPSGHVQVHIASRGLAHKFQSGKIYKSKTPYSLDFECIDGCSNVNYEAYPQVHNTPWGE